MFALPDQPLHEYILADAAQRGDHTALIDGVSGQRISYGELARLVEQTAAGLAGAGLGKGDVLAIYAPNNVLYPVVSLAASAVGATVTPVNPLATPTELAAQLRDSGAVVVVTIAAMRGALSELPETVREVLLFDNLRDLAGAMPPPAVTIDPEQDVALLPYSSGTSGTAKGVLLTHRNLTANIAQTAHELRFGPQHRVVAVLPFSHVYGFSTLMGVGLRCGSTLVVLPRFDLPQFLATLATHRITHALVAPPIAVALAKHPLVDQFDLSTLELVISAAAPLDERVAQAVTARIGTPVVQAYGMTELSPTVCVPSWDTRTPPGSVGRPLPGTECRLVDGELWVRGPQVMKGYLNQPAATAETIDADGWLHTGDVVRVDADGWYYIVDRVKELIKYKGYQVAPAELEAILLGHPRIADAAVIGVTDDEGTEIPKAFVVAAAVDLTGDEVMRYVAARVAPYKKIRAVEFIDAVPRSISGKILRRVLRDRSRQQQWQFFEAVHEHGVAPPEVAGRDGQSQLREALQ